MKKDSRIQPFDSAQGDKFEPDSRIQGFKDSKIQRFKDSRIQRFKDSRISFAELPSVGSRIQRFKIQ